MNNPQQAGSLLGAWTWVLAVKRPVFLGHVAYVVSLWICVKHLETFLIGTDAVVIKKRRTELGMGVIRGVVTLGGGIAFQTNRINFPFFPLLDVICSDYKQPK